MTLLRIEAVSASFVRGSLPIPVLRDVSLEVAAGELVAVYGKRASGKTTLLEIAAGLTEPDRGAVFFDGHNLAESSRRRLARLHREEIGWVGRDGPQTNDVPMRIYVAMPLYRRLDHRRAEQQAMAMLRRLGAGEYADALWFDLPDTLRMIVAIGQALIRDPRLLVVDDPVCGLGVTEREAVIGLLREVAEDAGIAVLTAVPEMPGVIHADHVRILANGMLVGPRLDGDGGNGQIVPFPRPRSA